MGVVVIRVFQVVFVWEGRGKAEAHARRESRNRTSRFCMQAHTVASSSHVASTFSQQQSFDYEEVKGIVSSTLESQLASHMYTSNKVPTWTSNIIEHVLKQIQTANKPFKYVGK